MKTRETHVCRQTNTCTCYQLALEPDESCPQHGAGAWPPRCATCGHFMKQKLDEARTLAIKLFEAGEAEKPKQPGVPAVRSSELVGLRPCPYCATKRLHLHEWMDGAYVHCECGGKGPPGYGPTAKIMACDLWNRREQPNEKAET